MNKKYVPLATPCDISSCSLGEAITMLIGMLGHPAMQYTLYVHPSFYIESKFTLKRLGASTMNNPLSPYINLCQDITLAYREWVLYDGINHVGSIGV